MHNNVGLILQKRASLTPDIPGLVDVATGTRLTFKALDQRANQAANLYLSLGVKKGDRVGLLLLNGLEFVESVFGLAKIGAIIAPLNWRLVADELDFIINDCGVSTLVFDSDFVEVVRNLQQRQTTVQQWLQVRANNNLADFAQAYNENLNNSSDVVPPINGAEEDVVYIMYTSGTTGLPKGVVHTHDTACWASITSLATLDLRLGDRYLSMLPLFHIGGLNPMVNNIMAGAAVFIVRTFDPARIWRIVNDEKITCMGAVPAMLNFMLQHYAENKIDHSHLRYCLVGAAPVPVSLIETYQTMKINLLQVYGLTESCAPGCVLAEHDALTHIGSTGKAFFHTDVKVVRSDGSIAAVGETGEILLRGPHIMRGYWNNPEATANTLQDGWLHTGDVGVMDTEGYITIKDRIKDMIISGGENIYPAEVESVLQSHPKILEAAVVGRPHEKWGESPLAFVVKKESDIDTDAIFAYCKSKLAPYKCPRDILFIDTLPRNPSGKILKRVLRDQYLSTAARENAVGVNPD